MLAAVAHEQALILAEVEVDLRLGQQVAGRLRQRRGGLDADAQRFEQLELLIDPGRSRQLEVLPDVLRRAEEECLVLDDGTADGAADLRTLERRLSHAAVLRLRKVVDRHHLLIPVVAERRSAHAVGARLGGDESPMRETVLHTQVLIRRSCGCDGAPPLPL